MTSSEEHFLRDPRYQSLYMCYGDVYYGYIIAASAQWLLLQSVHGFCPEGFVFLRVRDVEATRVGSSFIRRCLLKEGFQPRENLPFPVQLSSVKSILSGVSRHCRVCILERDYENESVRIVGRIEEVLRNDCVCRELKTTGKWKKTSLIVPYESISGVLFGNRYCEVFEKYALSVDQE